MNGASQGLAVFLSLYVRRWLEAKYDDLCDIPAVASFRNANPTAKAFAEAGLYAITAYCAQLASPKSVAGYVAVEVLKDAAPEIASRLLRDTREQFARAADLPEATATFSLGVPPSLASKLLTLRDAELLRLLLEADQSDEAAQRRLREFCLTHSAEEIARIASLPAAERDALLRLALGSQPDGAGAGFRSFCGTFLEVITQGAKKGRDIALPVLEGYVRGVIWLVKLCATLWEWVFVVWIAYALAGSGSALAIILGSCAAACGAITVLGRIRHNSWLAWSGITGGVGMLVLFLMTIAGRGDAVPGLSFLFFLGLPTLALVVLLAPLTVVLESVRAMLPRLYEVLAGVLRTIVVVFIGILALTVCFLLLPVRNNPAAIFILAPCALVLIVAFGIRVFRTPAHQFFGLQFKLCVVALLGMSLLGLAMPAVISKAANLPSLINDQFVKAPEAVSFARSQDIDFVDSKHGTSRIWYAVTSSGGYELFYCDDSGGFTQDGRALARADDAVVRQKIASWVDAQATLKQAHLVEQQRQATATAAEARRERFVNRQAVDQNRLDYIVVASSSRNDVAIDGTNSIANHLEARGRATSTVVLKPAFVKEGILDAFLSGNAGAEVGVLRLSEISNRLFLAKEVLVELKDANSVRGARTARVAVHFAVINALDGKILEAFDIAESGAGVNDAQAYQNAWERILEVLGQRAL